MSKIQKICQNCGKYYDICPSCEETYSKIYFAWRTKYCSPNCFMSAMRTEEKEGVRMRVQYNKKSYTLKSYNIGKDEYTLLDGTKIKVEDIDSFILSNKEFKEVVDFKKSVTKKKVAENTEVDE